MALIPLKVSFNENIRRISVSSKASFAELWTLITKLFAPIPLSNSNYAIVYTDADDERITVLSDEELQEAFRLLALSGDVFRIQILERASHVRDRYQQQASLAARCADYRQKVIEAQRQQYLQRIYLLQQQRHQHLLAQLKTQAASQCQERCVRANPLDFLHRLLRAFVNEEQVLSGVYATDTDGNWCRVFPQSNGEEKEGDETEDRDDEYESDDNFESDEYESEKAASPEHTSNQNIEDGAESVRASDYETKHSAATVTSEPAPVNPVAVEVNEKKLPEKGNVLPLEPVNTASAATTTELVVENSTITSAPVVPSAVSSNHGTSRVAEALKTLEEMGFSDSRANIEALVSTRGNVSAAIQLLLQ